VPTRADALSFPYLAPQRSADKGDSLNHMISNSGIAKQKGSNWVDSVIKSIQCLSPTFKASNMLAEAEAAYVTYNKAQAA
jgi:hypothetical protein